MGPRERPKEGIGVGPFAQRQGGKLQAHRPALRPGRQFGRSPMRTSRGDSGRRVSG
jgi:hypothetical protein